MAGLAWLDREWSTSALEPGVVGWDWFALHLSDGGSLMFYRLRTATARPRLSAAELWWGLTAVELGWQRATWY